MRLKVGDIIKDEVKVFYQGPGYDYIFNEEECNIFHKESVIFGFIILIADIFRLDDE